MKQETVTAIWVEFVTTRDPEDAFGEFLETAREAAGIPSTWRNDSVRFGDPIDENRPELGYRFGIEFIPPLQR